MSFSIPHDPPSTRPRSLPPVSELCRAGSNPAQGKPLDVCPDSDSSNNNADAGSIARGVLAEDPTSWTSVPAPIPAPSAEDMMDSRAAVSSSGDKIQAVPHLMATDTTPKLPDAWTGLQSIAPSTGSLDRLAANDGVTDTRDKTDMGSNVVGDAENREPEQKAQEGEQAKYILVHDKESLDRAVSTVQATKVKTVYRDGSHRIGKLHTALLEMGTIALHIEGCRLGSPRGIVSMIQVGPVKLNLCSLSAEQTGDSRAKGISHVRAIKKNLFQVVAAKICLEPLGLLLLSFAAFDAFGWSLQLSMA